MLDLQGFSKNFVWWMGVVEDRKDPKRLGRCRVRIFGYHTADKNDIPTNQLPWAYSISPIQSASMSGIGNAPVGPVEGTHVFGFFRDGQEAQFPVIVGTIPGIPEEASDTSDGEGFKDPNEKYPKDSDNHGLNESDLTRLARYKWDEEGEDGGLTEQKEDEDPPVVKDKKENRVKDVQVANGHGSFSEPETKFEAKYPYNHVIVTESGHIYEMDDTLNRERIHEYHRSGTFREIYPKGTQVTKVVRDNYEFVLGDNYVNIKKIKEERKPVSDQVSDPNSSTTDDQQINQNTNNEHGGNLYITVEGDVYEFIQGNVERQINGSVREVIGGNYHTHVNGDRTINIEGSQAEKIHEDNTEEYYNHTSHSLGNVKIMSEGTINIDSPKRISLTSVGGNINLSAQPHVDDTGIPGSCSGRINISSGNAIGIKSENNTNISSLKAGVSVTALEGGVAVLGSANLLLRSTLGKVLINSARQMSIVSSKNMYIGSPKDIKIQAQNLQEIIDKSIYEWSGKSITTVTSEHTIANKTMKTTTSGQHKLFTGDHQHGCKGDIQVTSGANQSYLSGGNIYLN